MQSKKMGGVIAIAISATVSVGLSPELAKQVSDPGVKTADKINAIRSGLVDGGVVVPPKSKSTIDLAQNVFRGFGDFKDK